MIDSVSRLTEHAFSGTQLQSKGQWRTLISQVLRLKKKMFIWPLNVSWKELFVYKYPFLMFSTRRP